MIDPHPTQSTMTTNGTAGIITAWNEGLFMPYLEQRRRALITELREIDKLLGRPQTVPEKRR